MPEQCEVLKPCPFCGQQPRQVIGHQLTWCVNEKCRLRGIGFFADEWNTHACNAALEAAQKLVDLYRLSEATPCIDPKFDDIDRAMWVAIDALAALLPQRKVC
jgi:hypothetical protein